MLLNIFSVVLDTENWNNEEVVLLALSSHSCLVNLYPVILLHDLDVVKYLFQRVNKQLLTCVYFALYFL